MSRVWLRLDNAALIFPAVKRPGWCNVFRQSVSLREDIDPAILQQAANDLKPRFPSLYVRLRTGIFWYYLEEIRVPLTVGQDFAYPLTHMGTRELRTCCLRIFYYRNRIAVEFFHALTDGTGGMIYLKTLAARYIALKYGIDIPASDDILDIAQQPQPEEIEDSFLRYSGRHAMSRSEPNSYRLKGTHERDGIRHLLTGVLPTDKLVEVAHGYHVTVTVFLVAVMAQVITEMQAKHAPHRQPKPVKITVPVNLRRLYGSKTLRNFVLTLNPGVDPKLGAFTLDDLCNSISAQLSAEAMPQIMAARIAANVIPQQLAILRIMPLFIKNLFLRMVYAHVGETKGCLNISNLGVVKLPEPMRPYVERMEFIIGVQYTYPNNCSVVSLGNATYVNMIRNIRETELEQRFFSRLVELGVPVTIESKLRGN